MIHESIDLVPATAKIIAMAMASGTVAAVGAFLFRWYSGHSIPEGIPILLGVSVVATALNTTATLQESIAANELVGGSAAGFTLVAFVVGAIAADAGRRFGQRVGDDLPSVDSVRTLESDVGSLVRAAGRVIRVRVPESIEDIDGYEPVPESVKTDLAGTTFLFPRRMTVSELRERLVERLKRDYEVGHVDVELADDGTVEYLALGRRLAGVGQTLAPGTVAVAIRADPAFTATAGDRVQIWRDPATDAVGEVDADAPTGGNGATRPEADGPPSSDAGDTTSADADGPTSTDVAGTTPAGADVDTPVDAAGASPADAAAAPEQVATGELRAAVDDVATIAIDQGDADRLSDDVYYRLVTLPVAVQPDREFAALLRNADETMGSIPIEAGSELDGACVDAIDLTVAALESDGDVTAIPSGDRRLAAGETVYVVGRPDGIRRIEALGNASAGGSGSDGSASDAIPTADADD